MNSGMKPHKQTVLIAKFTNKQFLLTNSRVITSILGVSGLELHFSFTEPLNFFGAQSSLGGHDSRLGGTSSDLGPGGGGTAPECPCGAELGLSGSTAQPVKDWLDCFITPFGCFCVMIATIPLLDLLRDMASLVGAVV